MTPEEIHQQNEERNRYTALILNSDAPKKIIVAGPGTGKSFTFQEFLKSKGKNNLALTFINSLAFDLQKDLDNLAESYTFHGYCKKLLHSTPVDGIDFYFQYFPKIFNIVESDSKIIKNNISDFQQAFHELVEDERINYYLSRSNYYNAVGHSDAVYRVWKYFKENPSSVPSFGQIVVDEFQDFNLLEVAFIDELTKKNPVLIAGDDDQAIYNFKSASPDHIRAKFQSTEFKQFELPYCSRCTQVIVDSIHDITSKAIAFDHLLNRVPKNYFCFLPDKEQDSTENQKVFHAICSTQTRKAPYISKYIERQINLISQADIDQARKKGYPCVLILGQSHYLKQIHDHLSSKFTNIDYPEAQNKDLDIKEGYRILMKNDKSNLGWRIILEFADTGYRDNIILKAHESNQQIDELLDPNFKSEHLEIVRLFNKIESGDALNEFEQETLINKLDSEIEEFQKYLETSSDDVTKVEDTSISIKLSTINGSKGLSANHVFITGMNDGEFPRNANMITDNEICQLIVGITRTRKRCHLISNQRFGLRSGIRPSTFVSWINRERRQTVNVNANYFKE